MNRSWYLVIFISLFASACSNNKANEEETTRNIDPEYIWFDYQVWGEEGNDSVTIKLQYMEAENGETILVEEPAKVELDGRTVPGNISTMMGPYYEMQYPALDFTGDHIIQFTGVNGEQYREEFSFHPIVLKAEIPDTIKRGMIIFHLSDLKPGGHIRILMTDTVYASEGINRVDTIKNGQVIIPGSDLSKLANGPIQMELIKEDERPVRNGTAEGGRISIRYGLKREFILTD